MPAPAIGLIARLLMALRAGRAAYAAAGAGRSAAAAGLRAARAAGAAAPRAAQAGAEAASRPNWFVRGGQALVAPETIVPMAGIMGLSSLVDSLSGGGEVPAGMTSMEELAGLEQLEDDPYLSDFPQRRSMSPIHR